MDLQAASSIEAPAHEQTSAVPGAARIMSAVKSEDIGDLNQPPAGPPDVLPTGMALPAVAVCGPIGTAGAELTAASVDEAQPGTTGADPVAGLFPEARSSTPATSGVAPGLPSRPTPTRPQFEPIVWELHQAYSARHPAQGDGVVRDPAMGTAEAAPPAAQVPETKTTGLAPDAAAARASAEPVVADGSTIKAAVHDAAAGGALAVASGSGGPKAAVPSKPRFRHSSITWQLHSAAMARRDDAAAQLAAALSAKPIQEGQETGAAETADDDESGGLQV